VSLFSRISLRIGTTAAALVTLALSGCSKADWMVRQSAMDPHGPLCQMQFDTFMDTVWLSLIIFVLVGGAFIVAVVKFREKPEDAGKPVPKQGHGNPMIEIGIIMLSIASLVVIAIPTLKGIWLMYDEKPEETYTLNGETIERKVSAKESALKAWYPQTRDTSGVENYSVSKDDDVLEITVVGKQWWFRFEYPQFGLEQSKGRSVSNEFVIPAGRMVKINLRSDDVIHSFWLPKVAGKVDLVPGRKNGMWIQADKTGNYYGQCAEFCGDSHAYMLFRCQVVSDAEFKTWIEKQKANAVAPATELAKKGEDLFKSKTCVMCHTVGGLAGAAGAFGPDVTHVGSRATLAGAWLFNYDDKAHAAKEAAAGNTQVVPVVDKKILKANLVQWIASSGMTTGPDGKPSKDVKPGNRMHNYKGMFGVTGLRHGAPGDKPVPLAPEEIEALAEYLAGLE
jgi:cytochrome c oxidase subunit 2